MTWYITKHALTKGIVEQEQADEGHGSVFVGMDGRRYVQVSGGLGGLLAIDKDVFNNLQDAQLDCIKRAKRKIKSLVKLEAKLNEAIQVWEKDLP